MIPVHCILNRAQAIIKTKTTFIEEDDSVVSKKHSLFFYTREGYKESNIGRAGNSSAAAACIGRQFKQGPFVLLYTTC